MTETSALEPGSHRDPALVCLGLPGVRVCAAPPPRQHFHRPSAAPLLRCPAERHGDRPNKSPSLPSSKQVGHTQLGCARATWPPRGSAPHSRAQANSQTLSRFNADTCSVPTRRGGCPSVQRGFTPARDGTFQHRPTSRKAGGQ